MNSKRFFGFSYSKPFTFVSKLKVFKGKVLKKKTRTIKEMSSIINYVKTWIADYTVKAHTVKGYTVNGHTVAGYTVKARTVKGHYRRVPHKAKK